MILHLTKSLSEKLNITLAEPCAAENRYCDWFLNLVYGGDRKFYILITNAFSAFSFVIPVKGVKNEEDLSSYFASEVKAYFEHKGLSAQFTKFIEPNLNSIIFTKTNNRSVLATMNGMEELLPWQIKDIDSLEEQKNRFDLDDDINHRPYKCANSGEKDYIFPCDFISDEKMTLPIPENSSDSLSTKKEKQICKLYVELMDFEPKIYRILYVPSDIKMSNLAYTLMSIFNAHGRHLYNIVVPVKEIKEKDLKLQGMAKEQITQAMRFMQDIEIESYVDRQMNAMDADFFRTELRMLPPEKLVARKVKVEQFIEKNYLTFYMNYDFGDGWEIKITVQDTNAVSPVEQKKLPYVEEGKGYGIIEDCGGIGGLGEIKKAFEKKSGEAYEQYKEWLGRDDVDLSHFDLDETNAVLKKDIRYFERMYREMEEEEW